MTKNDIYTYLAKSRKYVWEYICRILQIWRKCFSIILKSVFSEIRVMTWFQVSSFPPKNRPLIGRPDNSANCQKHVFWWETTWTHVLTRISEKTDFSMVQLTVWRLKFQPCISTNFLAQDEPQHKVSPMIGTPQMRTLVILLVLDHFRSDNFISYYSEIQHRIFLLRFFHL